MYRQATGAWARTQTSGAWRPHRPSTLQRVTYDTAPPGQATKSLIKSRIRQLKADEWRLEAFHMKCQRRILGIRWFHFVTNASVTSQTGEEGLAIRICRRRLSFFGYVRWLPEMTPTHSAVCLDVDIRAGINRTSGHSGMPAWTTLPNVGAADRGWTGLNANDAWRIAHDRKSWRALRPVAGQAFQWVSEWVRSVGSCPWVLYVYFSCAHRFSLVLDPIDIIRGLGGKEGTVSKSKCWWGIWVQWRWYSGSSGTVPAHPGCPATKRLLFCCGIVFGWLCLWLCLYVCTIVILLQCLCLFISCSFVANPHRGRSTSEWVSELYLYFCGE